MTSESSGWSLGREGVRTSGGMVHDDAYPYKGICAWDTCGQENIYYGPPVCNTSTLNDALRRGEELANARPLSASVVPLSASASSHHLQRHAQCSRSSGAHGLHGRH